MTGADSLVYVVDDDPSVLNAFRRLLEAEGYAVQAFDSPLAFLTAHDPFRPGCILLDVGMTEMSGLATQERLLELGMSRPIIFVSGHDDLKTGVLAMKGGARDYLVKPVPDTLLLAAVAEAVRNDGQGARARSELKELTQRWASLTAREQQVMTHVVRGRLNKQIAGDLGIVEKTVKVHRARVMEKMGFRSVAALVHAAERLAANGLMEAPADDRR